MREESGPDWMKTKNKVSGFSFRAPIKSKLKSREGKAKPKPAYAITTFDLPLLPWNSIAAASAAALYSNQPKIELIQWIDSLQTSRIASNKALDKHKGTQNTTDRLLPCLFCILKPDHRCLIIVSNFLTSFCFVKSNWFFNRNRHPAVA